MKSPVTEGGGAWGNRLGREAVSNGDITSTSGNCGDNFNRADEMRAQVTTVTEKVSATFTEWYRIKLMPAKI